MPRNNETEMVLTRAKVTIAVVLYIWVTISLLCVAGIGAKAQLGVAPAPFVSVAPALPNIPPQFGVRNKVHLVLTTTLYTKDYFNVGHSP